MNRSNYKKVEQLVVSLGNDLIDKSGKVPNVGSGSKFLTEEDIYIEERIIELINSFSGEQTFFSEELNQTFSNYENLWVIDPISNTYGFIDGWPHYSVVVCHIVKGLPVYAIVYDPSTREVFTAFKGKGVFLNGQRTEVRKNSKTKYILFPARVRAPFNLKQNISLLNYLVPLGPVRNIGSFALHYAYVACGRADVAITLNKDCFSEFAGSLLVEEAGGIMTDFSGKRISEIPRGVIAGNRETYDLVFQHISNSLKGDKIKLK